MFISYKTIRYNVNCRHLVAFCITSDIRFLNTPVYLQTLKDVTYSLNCIFVLLCTQSVYFVWAVVMGLLPWQTSIVLVYFQDNNQFQPDILFEISIIVKDMYILSPFDRFVLFFNCNLQHISKTRLQTV